MKRLVLVFLLIDTLLTTTIVGKSHSDVVPCLRERKASRVQGKFNINWAGTYFAQFTGKSFVEVYFAKYTEEESNKAINPINAVDNPQVPSNTIVAINQNLENATIENNDLSLGAKKNSDTNNEIIPSKINIPWAELKRLGSDETNDETHVIQDYKPGDDQIDWNGLSCKAVLAYYVNINNRKIDGFGTFPQLAKKKYPAIFQTIFDKHFV